MPTGVYIRTEITCKHISEGKRGKHSHESSEAHKKLWQNPEYRQHMIEAHKGKKQSKKWKEVIKQFLLTNNPMKRSEIRIKMSNLERGEKAHNWKGGVSYLDKVIRQSVNFKLWRESIFKRDNYTCQLCRKRGGQIFPHHIVPFVEIRDKNSIQTFNEALNCKELWDISNGIALCENCHKEIHNAYKNGFKEEYWDMLEV